MNALFLVHNHKNRGSFFRALQLTQSRLITIRASTIRVSNIRASTNQIIHTQPTNHFGLRAALPPLSRARSAQLPNNPKQLPPLPYARYTQFVLITGKTHQP
jgi:hypothetical protein